eukprot:1189536-Prorocentrum_minimum.AAC.4
MSSPPFFTQSSPGGRGGAFLPPSAPPRPSAVASAWQSARAWRAPLQAPSARWAPAGRPPPPPDKHTTALNIHTIALNIHTIALNIHTIALNIHTIALNIHTIALNIHIIALNIHTKALNIQ